MQTLRVDCKVQCWFQNSSATGRIRVIFYDDLVNNFEIYIAKPSFSDQFKKFPISCAG